MIANATDKIVRGQKAFRFDTFGDQAFWGDTLKLHQAYNSCLRLNLSVGETAT
jgi:hypothetical protein